MILPNDVDEFFDKSSETIPPSILKKIQQKRLQKVLLYAYSNCPFYYKLYHERGLLPSDVRTIDDFRKKVPIITKEDLVRFLPHDFTSGIFPRTLHPRMKNIALTSGVTGVNTFVVMGPRFIDRFVRSYLAREMWMEKLRPDMRVFLQISGWHFIALAMNRLSQLFSLNVISPRGTQMYKFAESYVRALRESNSDYMITTPSMLYSVLDQCRREGKEVRAVFESVKYISVAGETLSPVERSRLVDELGVYDIFESGGSVDGLWGGGECFAHKGHHVWMDHGLLEAVDPISGEPLVSTERGALVNTNFATDGSIYIRFNSQDYGEIFDDGCECGRTHHRVEIYDRLMNVVTIGTKRISIYELISCFQSLPETNDALFTIVVSPNNQADSLTLRVAQTSKIADTRVTERKLIEMIQDSLRISNTRIEWVLPQEIEFIHGKIIRLKKETDFRYSVRE